MHWQQRAFVSVAEAAEIAALPVKKLLAACDDGLLRSFGYRRGGRRLIATSDLDLFVRSGRAASVRAKRSWAAPNPKECVYVIGYDRFIKIGYTTNLEQRLDNLQTACPGKLKVHAILHGGRRLEHALHANFADYRTEGEWFTRAGDLARWITEKCPALFDPQ